VGQPGGAPAAPKVRRSRATIVPASCRLALNVGVALAGAASDNKSVNADAQGRPAAAPHRTLVAGYVRRYEAWR
jgi:hypothetical protein